MGFVYILQSLTSGRFYIGSSSHLIRRFYEHQTGRNKSTKNRGPWWMPYYDIYPDMPSARRREAEIKRKKSTDSIQRIIKNSVLNY